MLVKMVLALDIVVLNVLFYLFHALFGSDEVSVGQMFRSMITSSIAYLICTMHHGVVLYRRQVSNFQIVLRVMQNTFFFAIVSWLILTIGHFYRYNIPVMLLYWLLYVFTDSVVRILLRFIVVHSRQHGSLRRAVFVGSYDNNVAIYREMQDQPAMGYHVEGYFDDAPNPNFPQECHFLGTPAQVIAYLREHPEVHELYCCLPSKRKDEIVEIIHFCTNNFVHFYSVPNLSNYLHHRVYLDAIGNVPILSLYNEPMMRLENRLVKRLFDVVFSAVFLCTLFPIVFILVAIVTKITMPGPIFFRQKRTGFNGRDFYCLKFRSMKVNAEADTLQATKDDPRKTRWGDIMRKTNIDELPQFINVLLGDMSIVGPRPHMLKHTEEYSKLIGDYMVRHYVKPGVTGWSQVTGFRGETKEISQMEGRIRGDIWYIEHWSFWLDLYIIYKTIANVFMGDEAAY